MSIASATILCVICGVGIAWFFVETKAPKREPDQKEPSLSQIFGCSIMLILGITFILSVIVT